MTNNDENEECHYAKLVISFISNLITANKSRDNEYYFNS